MAERRMEKLMMTTRWMLLTVVVLISPIRGHAEIANLLDDYVTRAVADWEVPGLAIAVVQNGEMVFAKGYGVRELGQVGGIDEDTLFAVGSTTKAMTAAILGTMVDQEVLGWDDRVAKHWPGFELRDPYVSREVTLRDLLTHRAGLGNADLVWYGREVTRDGILEAIPLIEPAYSLRAGFVYQNLMYLAAGRVAERVSGASWEDLVRDRIFEPLGMKRTVPNIGDTDAMENVARPHAEIDHVLAVIENERMDAIGPAGTVWSSVSDMSRWLRLLLAEGQSGGEALLSESTVAELLKPQTLLDLAQVYPAVALIEPHWMSYSLGWFQIDYEGRAVSFHTGSIDGMSAMAGLVPDEELGVVILANRDHAELRHALLWKVIDLWGGQLDGRDWSQELQTIYSEQAEETKKEEEEISSQRAEGTDPSLPLERYAGIYDHHLFGELAIECTEGALRLVLGPRLSAELRHWHFDTFEARFDRRWQGKGLVTFVLDSAGNPTSIEVLGSSFRRSE